MSEQYALIAPAIPLKTGNRQTFTYRLPKGQHVDTGQIVTVPFGRRRIPGVVLQTVSTKPSYPTKSVSRVYAAALTPGQIQFAQWVAATMNGGLGYTLRLFFPPSLSSASPPLTRGSWRGSEAKEVSIVKTHLAIGTEKSRWPKINTQLKKALKENQQVLILVPELWMVEHSPSLYKEGLGEVFLYHGQQKTSDQMKVWNHIATGQPAIVIGTQKALFLPWQTLQVAVLEEESYDSHKLWDQYPRLDNRLALPQLLQSIPSPFQGEGKGEGGSLIISSTYPSLTTEHLKQRDYSLLTTHYKLTPLHPHLVPFSREDNRQRRLLPNDFLPELRTWYKDKEKILFLYNRREDTRESAVGAARKLPDIKTLSEILHKLRFAKSKILWLDQATAAKLSEVAMQKKLDKAQIIVATTAIFTKIQNQEVDRIAWLFPEQTIRYPDYRSTERARLLLARLQQIIKDNRRIYLLTKNQEVVSEPLLTSHEDWVHQELKVRQRYSYPPFTDIVRLSIKGKSKDQAKEKAEQIRQELTTRLAKLNGSHREPASGRQSDPKTSARSPGDQKIIIRGPYYPLSRRGQTGAIQHILLQGPLEELKQLYADLPVDITDPYPHQVL